MLELNIAHKKLELNIAHKNLFYFLNCKLSNWERSFRPRHSLNW